MAPSLICTVRGCGLPLARGARAFACPRGHSFDVARSGAVNLLQPQDRRSAAPGDSREAVRARERLFALGVGRALVRDLVALVGDGGAVVDAGCGPGFLLSALGGGCGVDLSAEAIRAAARRDARPLWVVANADRRLPFADGSVDVLLSVAGPKNPGEFARVLRRRGRFLLAVPAADDLAELREAALGGRVDRSRAEGAARRFAGRFRVVSRHASRERLRLGPDALRDLLLVTYRGQRRAAAERVAALPALDVTSSSDMLVLRKS